MQEGSFTITLAGEDIEVPPITIGQTIEMAKAVGEPAEILRIALAPVRPGITKAEILAMRGGIRALNAATKKILTAGEFLDPGEAKAAPPVEQAPHDQTAPANGAPASV